MLFALAVFFGLQICVVITVALLCFEVMSAVTRPTTARDVSDESGRRGRVAVLIPAHDEAQIITGTLAAIRPQLLDGDRLLVVADNCSDETAAVAAATGAEVAPRTDHARRGKGYALDFGVKRLAADPPDTLIIIDADCQPAPNCVDRLARSCEKTGRPTQARYLMHAQSGADARMKIAEFAWLVKNQVRPSGLSRIGFPTHLTGSGMAFPWPLICAATLASGHIVEDLKLGVDLACAGSPAMYCGAASIHSRFPLTAKDSSAQRTRWEHGHLHVIFTEAPRMFWVSLKTLDLGLFVLALDLCVPPVVLLMLVVVGEWLISATFLAFTAHIVPLEIASGTFGALTLALVSAWARFGRRILTLRDLGAGLGYALMKIPVYVKFLVARQVTWVRAKRDKE